MSNKECPICLENITINDVDGIICYTCNHIYCNKCSELIIFIPCPVCRQRLILEDDTLPLCNIILYKDNYLHLGIVFYKLAKKYINTNLDYSAELYYKAHKLGIIVPYTFLGDQFLINREYIKALTWYFIDINNSIAYFKIANIYEILNNYKKSLKYYKKSATLGYFNAISNIGLIYIKLKNYTRAIDWFLLGKKLKDNDSINNLKIYL
jgi:tetratricopeptide (TPR) repeat protein